MIAKLKSTHTLIEIVTRREDGVIEGFYLPGPGDDRRLPCYVSQTSLAEGEVTQEDERQHAAAMLLGTEAYVGACSVGSPTYKAGMQRLGKALAAYAEKWGETLQMATEQIPTDVQATIIASIGRGRIPGFCEA